MAKSPNEVVSAGARSVMARLKLVAAMEALADMRQAAYGARDALKAAGVPNVALAEGFVYLGQAEQALDLQMAAHGAWAKVLRDAGFELPSDDELSREMIRLEDDDKAPKKAPIQPRWR